jgi:iron(III) transport system substrate-binding protein
MNQAQLRLIGAALAVVALGLVMPGCREKSLDSSGEVVLYTSVDEPVATPIVREFERQTGLKVILKTDGEATKTAGLAERLEAEKDRPQADVWWSNEVFHTINLANRGLFAAHESAATAAIPSRYKDAQHRWAGAGLRVRVIAVSTRGEIKKPLRSLADLTATELKGKVCMARPTAGTTAGHVAVLYTLLGKEKAERFFLDLKQNGVQLLGGNSVVAEYVGQGRMLAGLSDNDDVDAAAREGGKIEAMLPDQAEGQMGTLLIPCTVGLVAGGPHSEAAKKLADYLLSKSVEKALIDANFAKYSVFDEKPNIKAMDVDYASAAANMREAVELALKVLEGR